MSSANNDVTIKEIQEWEKSFVKKKGIPIEEDSAIKIAVFKLVEEVGEVSKAILEGHWDEIQAEVSDIIVFACKIANIAESFHNTEKLSEVFKRKINYCETRNFDKKNNKLNKPAHKEFK